jgi:hypothetical protein
LVTPNWERFEGARKRMARRLMSTVRFVEISRPEDRIDIVKHFFAALPEYI